jgi:hypothetical protein
MKDMLGPMSVRCAKAWLHAIDELLHYHARTRYLQRFQPVVPAHARKICSKSNETHCIQDSKALDVMQHQAISVLAILPPFPATFHPSLVYMARNKSSKFLSLFATNQVRIMPIPPKANDA